MLGLLSGNEVNRHVKKLHWQLAVGPTVAPTVVPQPSVGDVRRLSTEGVTNTEGERTGEGNVQPLSQVLRCPIPGCSKTYKASGWLAKHIKSNHYGLAVPH